MRITMTGKSLTPTLGSALRQARLEAGLSREALARLLGVSRRNVRRYENGETASPILRHLSKLAGICGYDVELRLVRREPLCLYEALPGDEDCQGCKTCAYPEWPE